MTVNHRAISLCGAVGLIACAAYPARADEKGERILRDAFQRLYAARTYTGDFSLSESNVGERPVWSLQGHYQARKPNRLRVDATSTFENSTTKLLFLSDGQNFYGLMDGIYAREKVAVKPDAFPGDWDEEVNAFFGGVHNAVRLTADYVGTEQVADSLCDLVRTRRKDNSDPRVITYAVGQQDHLIHRVVKQDDTEAITTEMVSNLHFDVPLDDKLFVFIPPKGAKEYNEAEATQKASEQLVPVGQEAPAFEATDPTTMSRFSLAQVLDQKKAVLVNFWFYG